MRIISCKRDIDILVNKSKFKLYYFLRDELKNKSNKIYIIYEIGDNPRNLEWLGIKRKSEGFISVCFNSIVKKTIEEEDFLIAEFTRRNLKYIAIFHTNMLDYNLYSYLCQFIE